MYYKFQQFMQGRYGMDAFGFFLVLFGCAFNLILSFFPTTLVVRVLRLIPTAVFVWAVYRILSRNINKRAGENRKYTEWQRKFTQTFYRIKEFFQQRKTEKNDVTHRYFKCNSCRQKVRVPQGKGKIKITCPRCGNKFIKKT